MQKHFPINVSEWREKMIRRSETRRNEKMLYTIPIAVPGQSLYPIHC